LIVAAWKRRFLGWSRGGPTFLEEVRVYSSITLLALLGSIAPQITKLNLSWEQDYRQARTVGTRDNKPLAVFFGSGTDGWKQILRDGPLDRDSRKLLSERFVLVYVNQETDAGKSLAEVFDLAGKRGLVISDRTGGLMAFRHEGDLELKELTQHLTHYSAPDYVVTTTDSNKPALVYTAPAPVYQQPTFQSPFACQT
jgi:hypothetical protein